MRRAHTVKVAIIDSVLLRYPEDPPARLSARGFVRKQAASRWRAADACKRLFIRQRSKLNLTTEVSED